MKRREFLYLTITAISSLFFTSNIAFEDLASASSKHLIPSPEIKETNLKFVLPLENRTETDILIIHHIGEINRDVSAAEIHQWHLANGGPVLAITTLFVKMAPLNVVVPVILLVHIVMVIIRIPSALMLLVISK